MYAFGCAVGLQTLPADYSVVTCTLSPPVLLFTLFLPHPLCPPHLPLCPYVTAQTFAAQPMDAPIAAEPLTPQQTQKEWKPLTAEDLTTNPINPEQYKLPHGYHWYETMIVLRAMMDDQGR